MAPWWLTPHNSGEDGCCWSCWSCCEYGSVRHGPPSSSPNQHVLHRKDTTLRKRTDWRHTLCRRTRGKSWLITKDPGRNTAGVFLRIKQVPVLECAEHGNTHHPDLGIVEVDIAVIFSIYRTDVRNPIFKTEHTRELHAGSN